MKRRREKKRKGRKYPQALKQRTHTLCKVAVQAWAAASNYSELFARWSAEIERVPETTRR